MLTRRHVRIKVMQTLYSLSKSEDKTLKLHLDFLKVSIKKSYGFLFSNSFLLKLKIISVSIIKSIKIFLIHWRMQ